MGMTSSLAAWRNSYNSILLENGAITAAAQCMAFSTACQQHSLTLAEFVSNRKACNVPAAEVFAPTLMATISDWDDSWDALKRLLHLEDSHLERVISHYAKNHQPMTDEAYVMFKNVVNAWDHAGHRRTWYQAQTPEQSERTIVEAFATRERYRNYLHMNQKEAVELSVQNIKTASNPAFWTKFAVQFMESFSPADSDSQRIARHFLKHADASAQRQFVTNYQTRWENANGGSSPDNYAQWVSDVIQYQPQYASLVLDGVMKKNATILQSPIISSNMVVIDYFLNQGIAKVSGNVQVRNVLNALIYGKGSEALRERAWVKKLSLFGAKPSDVKKMEAWSPAMEHAFHYWMATTHQKYGPKSDNVYTYINREVGWEYERRFKIDLRSPAGFQAWRDKCQAAGSDPFAALAANTVLCDTWEQGCNFYSTNAMQRPMDLPGINFELFASDTSAPAHP